MLSFTSMYDSYSGQRTYVTIYRSIGGGTASNIVGGRGLVEIWNNDHRIQATTTAQFLDSPNTTSATTYKLQGTAGSSYNATYYVNRSDSDTDADYAARVASSITVMEVAA